MAEPKKVLFAPFSSCVHPSFWSTFSKKKLEDLCLDEAPVPAMGSYSINDPAGTLASLSLGWDALSAGDDPRAIDLDNFSFPSRGVVINTNTLDAFRSMDKKALLQTNADGLHKAIESGEALEDPGCLSRFLLLMHADLKKYLFYYWFAFPALPLPGELLFLSEPRSIREVYTQEQCRTISELFFDWSGKNERRTGCFILVEAPGGLEVTSLQAGIRSAYPIALGFADPWTQDGNPGWPLRNILVLLSRAALERLSDLRVIALKSTGLKDVSRSVVFRVALGGGGGDDPVAKSGAATGWEKNEKGQFGPRLANMRQQMDPRALAESSVGLNLRLMKWRLVPGLDLGAMSRARCLLLGSGTLGCNVARCLLGWGVAHVTFVDNGKVSYSNPVRQSLFSFEDCLEGGRPKAAAAAEALRTVFPGVSAEGVDLRVPMPGHPMSTAFEEEVEGAFNALTTLVQRHDVIFLLMDTRESRWLPTVMGALQSKLVINAALGFDSYMVMRHGTRKRDGSLPGASSPTGPLVSGSQLGCYFCNDVVAPGDSTRDRTLDQQCTVTRPGVSYQAAAIAVELMAAVLQHPDGADAPASTSVRERISSSESAKLEGVLGLVPHSARGFVHSFSQFLPTTPLFSHCTACSPPVLEALERDGFALLKRACNEPGYLERLSGLEGLVSDAVIDDVEELEDELTSSE